MKCRSITKIIKSGLISIIGIFLLYTPPAMTQQAYNPQELRDVQKIIAVVDDKPISLYDLKQRVLLFIFSSGAKNITPREERYFTQQALQSLIDDKLKIQNAKKYKTVISKKEQEQSFASYARQMRLTPKQLTQRLNQAGVHKESMLKQIEASLSWQQVIGGLLRPQVSISDEEIYSILDRMKANKGQEEYHVREIFLLVSDNGKREENKNAAWKIVKELKKRASFQVMARQFSQSTTSAVGGDLGWLMESQIDPKLFPIISKLKPGQITDPIKTDDGYYILQLEDKRKILTASINDTRVDLQHMLFKVSAKAQGDELAALKKKITLAAAGITTCKNLAEQGKEIGANETGSLGNLAISDLPKNLRKPILALAIGHATAPIKEKGGYRIFIVCGRQAPAVRLPTYDNVEEKLAQQRIGLLARRHLRDLRRDAIIDYK